jgi:hypothetical protein
MQKRIQHGAVRIAGARVYNQVTRFVNNEDVIIFVDDSQRDVLRLEADFFFDLNLNGDNLPA